MIPYAKDLPPAKPLPDYAAIELDQWLNRYGEKITKLLTHREGDEGAWFVECDWNRIRPVGRAAIEAYMEIRGYRIVWQPRIEGRYADPNYGTQGDIHERPEGFALFLLCGDVK